MTRRDFAKSTLKVTRGVEQPASINPDVLNTLARKKRNKYTADEYVSGILSGNRTMLSQAITLAESSLPQHHELIQEVIERCLPYSSNSVRIGITGVPGVGKSTFIETFGLYIAGLGRKVAVLAIDPSSARTKGSILGDKTRMERLSVHHSAYIRPSPSAGTLGGVARKTRETIILCEASGFDTVLIETVGVGQSETAVHSMTDFFLLLLLAGGGDDLQGIKRGIMEMADAVAVAKADGSNITAAETSKAMFMSALQMFPLPPSGWKPRVLTCSARENSGIGEIWEIITDYVLFTKQNGYFDFRRKQQATIRMNDFINDYLANSFYRNAEVQKLRTVLENRLSDGKITSYKAAQILIDKYHKR